MSDTTCHLAYPHSPHAWGDLNWCPGLTGDSADYAWPESTVAQLLAGLTSTRDADQADRFTRLLDAHTTTEEQA